CVARTVGGGAGALGGALAEMGSHATERALVDLAILLAARERQTPVLQFIDRRRRVAAQVFDGVLVAEPIGALDGVVHVPAPVILTHVAERGGNAALRRNGMRAGGKDFAYAGSAQTGFAASDHGTQTRSACTDHDDIVAVIFDRIGAPVDCRSAVRFSICRHVRPRTTASEWRRRTRVRSQTRKTCWPSGSGASTCRHAHSR